MFKINNNDFQILQKYKKFLMDIDTHLENIPRKDIFFKDQIREISLRLLENILRCSYYNGSLNEYIANIKGDIATLDFLLERLLTKRYINDKVAYKLGSQLVEINKMVTGWLNTRESKLV